jgi:hypothetical protein
MTRIACLVLVAAVVPAVVTGCIPVDNAPPERGFALSWRLVDAAAPDPAGAPALSCQDVGVATILVDALDVDQPTAQSRFRTEFTCDTLDGVTPAIPESRYQVLLVARASDGTSRSQIKFDASNYDDASADLGLTIFQVALK